MVFNWTKRVFLSVFLLVVTWMSIGCTDSRMRVDSTSGDSYLLSIGHMRLSMELNDSVEFGAMLANIKIAAMLEEGYTLDDGPVITDTLLKWVDGLTVDELMELGKKKERVVDAYVEAELEKTRREYSDDTER